MIYAHIEAPAIITINLIFSSTFAGMEFNLHQLQGSLIMLENYTEKVEVIQWALLFNRTDSNQNQVQEPQLPSHRNDQEVGLTVLILKLYR